MTPNFHRCILFLSTFLMAAVLTLNCSSSTDKTPDPIHSCNLMTVQEIEGLIGATVEKPPRETHNQDKDSGFWMSMCNWYSPDTGASLGVMIKPIDFGQKTAQTAYDAYAKSMQENMPDYKMVPVEGIGTKAVWNGPTGQLTIFYGSHFYIISAKTKNGDEKTNLELAKKTGQLVLSKS